MSPRRQLRQDPATGVTASSIDQGRQDVTGAWFRRRQRIATIRVLSVLLCRCYLHRRSPARRPGAGAVPQASPPPTGQEWIPAVGSQADQAQLAPVPEVGMYAVVNHMKLSRPLD